MILGTNASSSQSEIISRQNTVIEQLTEQVEKSNEYKSLTNEKLKQAAAKLRDYRTRLEKVLQNYAEAQKEISELKASKSLQNCKSVAMQTSAPIKPQVRNAGCNTMRNTRREFATQTDTIVSPVDINSENAAISAQKRRRRSRSSCYASKTAFEGDHVDKKIKVDIEAQTAVKISKEKEEEIDRELASSENEMEDDNLLQADDEKVETCQVDEVMDEAFAGSMSSDDNLNMDEIAAEIDAELDTPDDRLQPSIGDSSTFCSTPPSGMTSAIVHTQHSFNEVQLSLSESSTTSSSSESDQEGTAQQTSPSKIQDSVEESVSIEPQRSLLPQPKADAIPVSIQSALNYEAPACPGPSTPPVIPTEPLSAKRKKEEDRVSDSLKTSIPRRKSQTSDLFRFRKLLQNRVGKKRTGGNLQFVQMYTLLETYSLPYISSFNSADRFCDSLADMFSKQNVSIEKALEAASMYFRSIRIGGKNVSSSLKIRSELCARVILTLARAKQRQPRGSESGDANPVDFQESMYQCLTVLRHKILEVARDDKNVKSRTSQPSIEKQLYWRAHLTALYMKLSSTAFSVESARVFIVDLLFYEPNLHGLFLLRMGFMVVPHLWFSGGNGSDWIKSGDALAHRSRDLLPTTILHIVVMIAAESGKRKEEIGNETGIMILTALGEFVEDLKWTLEGITQDATSLLEWIQYLWATIEAIKKSALIQNECEQNHFMFEICTCFGLVASAMKESVIEKHVPLAKIQKEWEESMDERTRKCILLSTAHIARGLIQSADVHNLSIPKYVTQVVCWYQHLLGFPSSICESLQRDCVVALVLLTSHYARTSPNLDEILGWTKCLAEWIAFQTKEALLLLPSTCLDELKQLSVGP